MTERETIEQEQDAPAEADHRRPASEPQQEKPKRPSETVKVPSAEELHGEWAERD